MTHAVNDRLLVVNWPQPGHLTQEDNSPMPTLPDQTHPSIEDLIIREEGVTKLLRNINPAKASGPDNIPNRILKEVASEISPALTAIYTRSISEGTLPDDWRSANVAPIFKKGSRHEASNYRPVSLTSVCCKVLEHIICKHILNYLDKFNLLSILQHGFRFAHSCETQLLLTLHDITSMFDAKKQIDIAILDFSKAFDTVPHQKLLHKLKHLGIQGNVIKWIQSFLTNRDQSVIVEGETSKPITVKSGVPQGTVLGPLLFLCFINDLPDSVTSQVRLFADDCLLYRPISSAEDSIKLQEDLTQLEKWAKTWGMSFNANKCYILRVSRNKQPITHYYQLNDLVLKQVHENPYLGVLLSDDLKWSKHVNKTCSKATSILAFLRRNLKQCPTTIKATAFKSLVRSILEYSSSVWDPHLQKDIQKIEKIQRRGARFVTGSYGRESSVTTMLKDLQWDELSNRRRTSRLAMMYKIIHGLVAIPSEDLLEPNTGRTRSKHGFRQYRCNTNIFKYSYIPRTIIDWNNLPINAKTAITLEEFKSSIS